jgi:histidyl-tRNA synthetase
VECFGFAGPAIDAELLGLCADFWSELGVQDALTLELNTLGSPESRAAYRDALLAYLRPLADQLDEDSQRRLERNPLRILDSKVPETQALLAAAPDLAACLDEASQTHFDDLRRYLDALAIPHVVNPRIVRGLDYYTHTVFEWTTTALGAQGTVCGGGRYDGLVERLGGRPTPGIGFAMGLERLTLLVEALGAAPAEAAPLDVYVLALEEAHSAEALALGQRLRQALPALTVQVHCSGGKAKARFKKADASGARYALILGEREIAEGTVALKPLREGDAGQTTWTLPALVDHWREGLPSPSSTDVATRR